MIHGFVELLGLTHVSGWAFEDSVPNRPVRVRVLLDGNEIIVTVADQFRQDLKDAGIGTGRHGFHVEFGEPLQPAARHRLEVRAFDELGRIKVLPLCTLIQPLEFAPACDEASEPVFILGAPRSGTSAMAASLRATGRYRAFAEGHLLSLLPALMNIIAQHYEDVAGALEHDTMLATVPRPFIEARIGEMFISIVKARFDTPYWLDKTPSNAMIRSAPLFASIWPRARFIFMKRRGIENLASRIRKFQPTDFEAQCRDWAGAMLFWSRVRDNLADKAVEIDQLRMARDPSAAAAAITPLLGLDSGESARFVAALASMHPERTGRSVAEVVPMERTGWTADQQAVFRQFCGPMMRLYDYTETEDYLAEN